MAGRLDDNDDELDELHDINVTPFIDVMLVLLIIFMVAAPLSTVDVPVELPSSTATAKSRPEKPVFVTIKSDLGLVVGEATVVERELGRALDRIVTNKATERIFLRADASVPYGALMRVMNTLRDDGYAKIALVGIEGEKSEPSRQRPDGPSVPR